MSFYLAALSICFYKDIAYSEITTGSKLLGYIALVIYIFPKQKNIKFKRLDFLVYGLVFVVNIYVVYEVVKMISGFIPTPHMVVLYSFYGVVLISLYMLAFRYRLLYHSRSKDVLLLTTFLTAAEILGIIAFFLEYEFLYYFENFFFLFGLGFGVTAFIDENKKGRLHRLMKTRRI
ncbi:hypothetical protein [Algibacter pacificus]|uniref:hypothetical protein n=1 Tax=Algibacter pacificus TaxID=2599389 RepID=UPI0011CC1D1D|nr:hypothetical protein [Algibacter pacificus]